MARRYSVGIAVSRYCGAISSLAGNWEETWEGLIQGASYFQAGDGICPNWPELPPVSIVADHGGWARQPDFLDRFQKLAYDVARQIQAPAAKLATSSGVRAALLIAGSHGDPGPVTAVVDRLHEGAVPSQKAWRGLLRESVVETISSGLGVKLPAYVISGSCASSVLGASYAADMINAGLFDVIVLVGIDSMSRITASGFYNIGAATASSRPKPFDSERDGTTVGEGAIACILCREEILQQSEIKGYVLGTSFFCDAAHPVAPDADGVARALRGAMRQAGVAAADVCGVYWHGTGTKRNDEAEAQAALLVFGEKSPPCTSTKGSLGHAIGASGGFNILAACETVATGIMPHVPSLTSLEYSNLDVVRGESRQIKRGPVLVTASGFGGVNAAAVIAPKEWRATA